MSTVTDNTQEELTALRNLRDVVQRFFKFVDSQMVSIPYEARLELKRRHMADMRDALGRSGSTITEVLVALMIFAIGVVSVATMFPLSVLRSIRATQLTKATELRLSAEALMEIYPDSYRDPDNDPATANWPEVFVVDPLGWYHANQEAPAFADNFGNIAGLPSPVRRYHLGRTSKVLAESFSASPDSHTNMFVGVATAPQSIPPVAGGVTQVDVSGLPAVQLPLRAVIQSSDGHSCQTRQITEVVGTTIRWTEDINSDNLLSPGEDINGNGALDHNPLPGAFSPERAIVDSWELRYSWMATVRRSNGLISDCDIVVFFNRPLSDIQSEETIHDATILEGSRSISVTIATGTEPLIKRGSFVLDTDNLRWYRMTQSVKNPAGQIDIRIETPAVQGSPPTGGHVMFPRGIVDVFPIGGKS